MDVDFFERMPSSTAYVEHSHVLDAGEPTNKHTEYVLSNNWLWMGNCPGIFGRLSWGTAVFGPAMSTVI